MYAYVCMRVRTVCSTTMYFLYTGTCKIALHCTGQYTHLPRIFPGGIVHTCTPQKVKRIIRCKRYGYVLTVTGTICVQIRGYVFAQVPHVHCLHLSGHYPRGCVPQATTEEHLNLQYFTVLLIFAVLYLFCKYINPVYYAVFKNNGIRQRGLIPI